jgi:glycerol kinase
LRVVAIDQGTTSTRAFVLGGSGPHAKTGQMVCRRVHKQHHPAPGWVEHDPEEILSHIRDCLNEAGQADAIGLGNQGESCLAWDRKTGRAVSPILVWQDQRTAAQIEALKASDAEATVMQRAGLPLDSYFSASKLAWILEHLPEARALLAQDRLCLGTTDAFFLHRLTGHFVTDITTASRTSLMNLETGQWDEELCALFGVPLSTLPDIVPTMGNFGQVRLNGRTVPLTASVVDQQAALYGHGCRAIGDIKITFGTGAFVLAVTGKTLRRPAGAKLLPTVAWQMAEEPPTYALDGGVYSAASAVNWARSLGLFTDFDEINSFDSPPAIERDLVFVPALSGLGCPYWDKSAAGAWFGLSLKTSRSDMMQALLEGIALRSAQIVDVMAGEVETGNVLSIDGGLSVNAYFCQFLADISQKTVLAQTSIELTSLGVAHMAMGLTMGLTNPGLPTAARTYSPKRELASGRALFEKAVQRTRGWSGV